MAITIIEMGEVVFGGPESEDVERAEAARAKAQREALRERFAVACITALEPPKFYVGASQTREELNTWASHVWLMADALLNYKR